jgi:uncharacterized protein (TIGR02722 family)
MNRRVCVTALCALLAAAGGCSSNPRVNRVDAETQVDLSGQWNDTDVRQVCETLITGALASPRLNDFIKEFSAKNGGRLPTVIVGRFRNTSSEHIDTGIIAGRMRTAIINAGKLEFVEGGEAREDLRAERQDQQSNAGVDSAAALANETGAQFMLTGEVRSIVDQAGDTAMRTYFVKATLTNIETSRIIWEDENNEIKKIIRRPRAKF